MKEEHKNQVIKLSEMLQNKCFQFIMDILTAKGDQHTSDLINIVLSAHLNSLIVVFDKLSSENEIINKKVTKFINDLIALISTLDPITNVELIKYET